MLILDQKQIPGFELHFLTRSLVASPTKVPRGSDANCQVIRPAYHLSLFYAVWKAVFKSAGLIQPVLEASPGVTGLPTTILLKGIPRDFISITDVPLKYPPDCINKVL